jgi:hypothetical protein
MIPTDLMDYPFIVIDAEEEISPTVLAISNQSHAYLYFTFVRQSQTITIISSVTMRYFNELQEKYLSLQSELDSVNATYYAVLDSYRSVLQSDIDDLNATYQNLMDGYTSLTYNYTQLQQDYFALNSSFMEISSDFSESMQNLRNIAYIFAVTTAIFLAAIVYLSKATNGRRQSQD